MTNSRVLFHAVDFCFGPAAHCIATAEALARSSSEERWRMIATGERTAKELMLGEPVFEHVFPVPDTDREMHELLHEQRVSVVVSIGDFELAAKAKRVGARVLFVDALSWMWSEPLPISDMCDVYVALAFPGMDQQPDAWAQAAGPGVRCATVPQIVRRDPLRTSAPSSPRDAAGALDVIVNFGGMDSPLGSNDELAVALIEDVLVATGRVEADCRVIFCTSQRSAARLSGRWRNRSREVPDLRHLPQRQFMSAVGSAAALLTVPGMSIVYEAKQLSAPTYFLLPLNYSQHLQGRAYRRRMVAWCGIDFDDLDGYASLTDGLPEAQGVARAQALGARYRDDRDARCRVRDSIATALEEPDSVLQPPSFGDGLGAAAASGAEEIAAIIRKLARREPRT